MRIVIATVQVPFVWGGAEFLAANLKRALEKAGHKAEIVAIPFKWYPSERIPEHILISRLIDLTESNGNKIDLLIGLKFPAYYFRHSHKMLWVLHQHRHAYELREAEYCDLETLSSGVLDIVVRADNLYLKEASKIFTISRKVSDRLERFNHIQSTPLYHPCPDAEQFYCESYGDFILFPSRLSYIKRQHLAVDAMRYVRSPLKLYIAGEPDSPPYLESLKQQVRQYHLEEKVKLLKHVSEEEKRILYAQCRAVIFPPFDEDYGYVTLEAMYSGTPVITCEDSGGPLEFIEDGDCGFVRKPDPVQIAEAVDVLGSEAIARRMGERGRQKIMDMHISWEQVVRELTGR
jgi:glycosyltransferase involved in cell wall biosynthesis